ncbi:deoxyribose-phosphate aldolase [Parasphaerochaeta coccoides]|uniref:Deoxyribose-phosphate aldolase n=1 Tax=Parasphaerochaeta coccoides (strain ATCC BAA-1237 / DSM 17374 / SPN1) TaxID=760011 RepID=F4GIB9_PARC1|nr:deoxyribose-phosphate aldolase [Parasphaerochaeta coccoides]AEC01278.1 Deoxyribose-phosphate aldolase [Parasphaerochaeta coccoides DSM 17374]
MYGAELSGYLDHTLLAADATEKKIKELCAQAAQYHFASVCVNSCHAALCADLLAGTPVKVCTVVGFPLGAMSTPAKAYEAYQAVADGAGEVDMVINIGALKDGNDKAVEDDIAAVKKAVGDKLLKVIIEACLLTDEEKVRACTLAVAAGADYVKTSTGFSKHGATIEDVRLMRKTVGPDIGVKAAGGIRDRKTALDMIEAGASRIGTSNGVALVEGTASDAAY